MSCSFKSVLKLSKKILKRSLYQLDSCFFEVTNPKENTDLREQIEEIATSVWVRALDLQRSSDFSDERVYSKARKSYIDYSIKEIEKLVHQARVDELESLLKLTQGVYDTRSPFVIIENISESMVTATNSMIQARLANLEKFEELESKEVE